MPLKLIPPGERKGNKYYLVRGTVDGREYEFSTGEKGRRLASQAMEEIENQILQGNIPASRKNPTFGEAADLYIAIKNPRPNDKRYIDRLRTELDNVRLSNIRQTSVEAAANVLYPDAQNQTKNRQVIVPVSAIMRLAAKAELCRWVQFEKLKEGKPRTRRTNGHDIAVLLDYTEGPKRLLLTTLYYQGWRITETLGWEWGKINFFTGQTELYISKSDAWKEIALHPETLDELALVPPEERTGMVFPWRTRSGVYKWLWALLDGLREGVLNKDKKNEVKPGEKFDIAFTPHMARHAFGSDLGNANYTSRRIKEAGTWTSEKSVQHYVEADPEATKQAVRSRPKATRQKNENIPKSGEKSGENK